MSSGLAAQAWGSAHNPTEKWWLRWHGDLSPHGSQQPAGSGHLTGMVGL